MIPSDSSRNYIRTAGHAFTIPAMLGPSHGGTEETIFLFLFLFLNLLALAFMGNQELGVGLYLFYVYLSTLRPISISFIRFSPRANCFAVHISN